MNTRQFRGIRNNPSRHCEARQAPQQRTLFRGTGNRGHVADGLNHKRPWPQPCSTAKSALPDAWKLAPSCYGHAIRATPSATSFRAERVTREASARPRDAHNYPSRHCEARPAPQQSTHFRGTRRLQNDADGLNPLPRHGLNHVQPPKVHFRMLGHLPLRATAMPIKATPSATSFRAERSTREASARPRDAHNYPSRHCEAGPAPQQSTHFRGRGDWRDVADCFNLPCLGFDLRTAQSALPDVWNLPLMLRISTEGTVTHILPCRTVTLEARRPGCAHPSACEQAAPQQSTSEDEAIGTF
ncbi:hypothetical protein Lal_00043779 [Lupinus albus]|nr:hypothetical protein Lal_00043779 [Lupinus albus]